MSHKAPLSFSTPPTFLKDQEGKAIEDLLLDMVKLLIELECVKAHFEA